MENYTKESTIRLVELIFSIQELPHEFIEDIGIILRVFFSTKPHSRVSIQQNTPYQRDPGTRLPLASIAMTTLMLFLVE
ncbi:hypothetical protein HALLA_05775 [Halostagnicola larsenii XH-48]|uniref:Uncharacterized protein n=1 Tax=Halostagnicola larsenii XH-48 TaxID=797299 RepID=W0JU02_9EURY|nr:hypothetical protein HALLA_05775 [Halostagnicola larsenii XH-48]